MLIDSDRIRLVHMCEAANEAIHYCAGSSMEDLQTNRPLQSHLIRLLEIIGEAAGRVSVESRSSYPDLPWSRMIGLRNRLIHVYFDIDLEIIWNTVVDELPGVAKALSQIDLTD